jgi:Ca-activated chloride channel homolog
MNNLIVAALPLFVTLCLAQVPSGQTRERRVGQAPADASPSPSNSARDTPPGKTNTMIPAATAVGTPEEVDEGAVVKVNTALVTVPVSVMNRNGTFVANLSKEDFRIFENGVEQEVAYFAAVEKPFTVVLMLDTSASTWSKLGQIRDAAIAFVDQLRPDDQVMVVSFARGVTIKCEPTVDRHKIRKAIRETGRGMSTHLYDAMDKVMLKHLDRIQGRKAVVLFTDGVDATSSDATYEGTVRTAEELDALIYPVLYDTYDPASDRGNSPTPSSGSRLPSIFGKIPFPVPIPTQGSRGGTGSSRADYDRGERYLRELADLSGGRLYEARRDLSYLRAAFGLIAEELRRQYSLGYYPNAGVTTGGRRQIKVRVGRPDVAVRARDSYIYRPSQTSSGTTKTKEDEQQPTLPVLQKKPFAVVLY